MLFKFIQNFRQILRLHALTVVTGFDFKMKIGRLFKFSERLNRFKIINRQVAVQIHRPL